MVGWAWGVASTGQTSVCLAAPLVRSHLNGGSKGRRTPPTPGQWEHFHFLTEAFKKNPHLDRGSFLLPLWRLKGWE